MKNGGYQEINCTVTSCTHNRGDDCKCRLESISVCPCIGIKKDGKMKHEEESACASYEPLNGNKFEL